MIVMAVSVSGIERVHDILSRLQNIDFTRSVRDGCAMIADDMRRYPPLSEANMPPSPPPGRFYVRHVGSMYVSRNGNVRQLTHSQRLGISWYIRIVAGRISTRGIVSTKVTYAPLVHDHDEQLPYHKQRGWPTTRAVLQRRAPLIINGIRAVVHKAIS